MQRFSNSPSVHKTNVYNNLLSLYFEYVCPQGELLN